MKIAIIGTRGIPNYYGGFEQFAEYLAQGLVNKGVDIYVYNGHNHPYKDSTWNGVNIIHCTDPEDKYGTIGQFIYDLNCILDSRKRSFDIILQLGYTSSTIWGWLLPSKSVITTNMDGLEWKRSKYSKPVRLFLKFAEFLGTKFSNHWISDSIGIKEYLQEKYALNSIYIPYGAHVYDSTNDNLLKDYKLRAYGYNMLVARLEPENNIEMILNGVSTTESETPFLVIGKNDTDFGRYLKNKFCNYKNIRFLGGIYDISHLNCLRYYSNLYFHGHSVGGTNPSLLEAMSSSSLICAHNNVFNSSILGTDAYYFSTVDDVKMILENVNKMNQMSKIQANLAKIKETYSWDKIINQYFDHFNDIIVK